MTITRTGLDVRRVGGRIGAELAGVDGRRSYVVEGDDAGHYSPKAA